MLKYEKGISVSSRMCTAVIDYYTRLYENYEMKTIPKIADYLGCDERTVRTALSTIYHGKRADGSFSIIDLRILLCTKFGSGSPYLEDQQDENIQRLIKRRKIIHELKSSMKNGILQEQIEEKEETDSKRK